MQALSRFQFIFSHTVVNLRHLVFRCVPRTSRARIDGTVTLSLPMFTQRGGMTPSGASVGDNYPSLLDDTGEPHACLWWRIRCRSFYLPRAPIVNLCLLAT
jgi:hypothetical protein